MRALGWSMLILMIPVAVRAEVDADPELVESDDELVYGEEAVVEAPPREAKKRTLRREELTEVAGTRGDAMRAIELLPGVGRPSDGDGTPILRGAASFHSLVLIDGMTVPLLYHFGSLTSVVSSRLFESVDVYPSNFGARYGRMSGGVVEANLRRPAMDGLHGMVDVSLVDSAALVEGPVARDTSVAVAARRSNIDVYFDAFAPDDAYGVIAAPVYWDYQAVVERELSNTHSLRAVVFGSRDRIELRLARPLASDPELRGDAGGRIEFHNLALSSRGRRADGGGHRLLLGASRQLFEQKAGPNTAGEFKSWELTLRGEVTEPASRELTVVTGVDAKATFLDGTYRGTRPRQLEGDPLLEVPNALGPRVELADTLTQVAPGAYLELGWSASRAVRIVPALRLDAYFPSRQLSVDPRLTTRFALDDSTALGAGVGLYSQAPQYYEIIDVIGNPKLEPERSLHASLGVERRFSDDLSVELEGFAKRMTHRVVTSADGNAPYFVNDGDGRVIGAELGIIARPTADTRAQLAYTLSRSERRDRNGPWRRFDSDQTHNVVAALHQRLGAGFSAGARLRVVSGNPSTPVLGSVYDARVGLYRPLYGAVGSEEDPLFFQLDVLVQKQWQLGAARLMAYLDLQNATNAENAQGRAYSYDYSRSEPVRGLPILPNLGLRGEL